MDFFWINRDQRSFEWFVNLLSQLEIEQAEQGGAMERFLDMHMYITSALQKTDMKAVGLQLALDLLHKKVLYIMKNLLFKSMTKPFLNWVVVLKRTIEGLSRNPKIYLELVYLVTALVPSDTACLANSPGRRSLTAVWISREVMVDLLL